MVQNHNTETKQGIQIWAFIQTPPSGFSSLSDPRLEGTYFLSSGRLVFCKASSNSYTSQLKILGRELQFWLPQTRLANLSLNQKHAPLASLSQGEALPGEEASNRPGTAPLHDEDGFKFNPEEYTKIWLSVKAKLWLSHLGPRWSRAQNHHTLWHCLLYLAISAQARWVHWQDLWGTPPL